MKAQMSIFAPTAEDAKKEVVSIAQECGSITPKILDAIPEGKGHYWLVTYSADPSTVRSMEAWVS